MPGEREVGTASHFRRLWSTIYLVATPALCVPSGLDRDGLERYREEFEQRLLNAALAAETSAQGGPAPMLENESDGDSNYNAST